MIPNPDKATPKRQRATPPELAGSTNGGPALFRLVRFWSRRWVNEALFGVAARPTITPSNIQHVQVVEAVAAVMDAGIEPHVNEVATQLALDQSGASRMIRDAVSAGYLTRGNSSHDRRRAVIEPTEQGLQLRFQALQWQQQCFDALTSTWSDQDRRRFSSYLQRLADEIATPLQVSGIDSPLG